MGNRPPPYSIGRDPPTFVLRRPSHASSDGTRPTDSPPPRVVMLWSGSPFRTRLASKHTTDHRSRSVDRFRPPPPRRHNTSSSHLSELSSCTEITPLPRAIDSRFGEWDHFFAFFFGRLEGSVTRPLPFFCKKSKLWHFPQKKSSEIKEFFIPSRGGLVVGHFSQGFAARLFRDHRCLPRQWSRGHRQLDPLRRTPRVRTPPSLADSFFGIWCRWFFLIAAQSRVLKDFRFQIPLSKNKYKIKAIWFQKGTSHQSLYSSHPGPQCPCRPVALWPPLGRLYCGNLAHPPILRPPCPVPQGPPPRRSMSPVCNGKEPPPDAYVPMGVWFLIRCFTNFTARLIFYALSLVYCFLIPNGVLPPPNLFHEFPSRFFNWVSWGIQRRGNSTGASPLCPSERLRHGICLLLRRPVPRLPRPSARYAPPSSLPPTVIPRRPPPHLTSDTDCFDPRCRHGRDHWPMVPQP